MNENEQRDFWNNKYPQTTIRYRGRAVPDRDSKGRSVLVPYDLDVRRFISADNAILQDWLQDEFHEMAHLVYGRFGIGELLERVQSRVIGDIIYLTDDISWGSPEFWQLPEETLARGKGDCEDGAILICSLCLNAGVPAYMVRVAGGLVRVGQGAAEGGHGWCSVLDTVRQKHVVVDWCYLPEVKSSMKDRTTLDDREEYRLTWFSFNHEHAWSHKDAPLIEGRLKEVEDLV